MGTSTFHHQKAFTGRGLVTQFRSDRGTNFVGATDDLSIDAQFVENSPVADFLNGS